MRRARGEEGQALVELAFVIPLVLLFLFAIIDFGLALNASNTDTDLANLAARQASLLTTTSMTCNSTQELSLNDWVRCEAGSLGVNTGPTASPNLWACVQTTSGYGLGDPIKIRVMRNFSWTGIVGGLGSSLSQLDSTITSSATMRIEQTIPSGTSSTFLTGSAC